MTVLRFAVPFVLLLGAARADAPALYSYDAGNPPQVALSEPHAVGDGVTASDFRFTSAGGQAVTGEIVFGAGAGPHPGVLFVHWLGEPKTTNHTEFEPDAIALAGRGVTSVLIDTMWSKPD
ncbi:hypothetical protein sos41_15600 [Alphaproteobacteria bacterium SO-S41]|nr:hypothetical protein sos41_15600 [Alphaproteobacteria bacterium SO-S41]